MKQALHVTFMFIAVATLAVSAVGAGTLEKGIKVGLNFSSFEGKDARISDSKAGIVGGAFATYLFNDNLGVQLEALYAMKGAVQETSFLDSGEVTVSYLEFPLLGRIVFPIKGKKSDKPSYFNTGMGVRPGFYVGPAISFCLTKNLEVLRTSLPAKSIDLGIVIGGGFDFEVGKGMITFDARYTIGKSTVPDIDEDLDFKNISGALMLGYAFR